MVSTFPVKQSIGLRICYFAPTVLRGPACLPGKAEVYQEFTNCTHTYTAGHGYTACLHCWTKLQSLVPSKKLPQEL